MYVGVYLHKVMNYDDIMKSLKKVKNLGANFLQFYVGSSYLTTLREKIVLSQNEIDNIKTYMKKHNIKIVFHGLVRLNFCLDPTKERFKWGINNLIYDMNLAHSIGAEGVIIHLGYYKTKKIDITYNTCIKYFIESIKYVLNNVDYIVNDTNKPYIFIETSCNQNNSIGGTLEELAELYNKIPKKYRSRVKLCVDSAHIFLAGYDIRIKEELIKYFDKFDKLIGIENLNMVHLNDTLKELGSKINRHAPIGEGYIFKDKQNLINLINILKKYNLNIILETDEINYKKEIKTIKNIIDSKSSYKSISKKIGGNNKNKNKNKDKDKDKDKKKIILKILTHMVIYYKSLNKNTNNSMKYRIDSYEKCIKIIKSYNGNIHSVNNIKHLPYIGKGFIEKIDEIIKTGKLQQYNNIKKTFNFNLELEKKSKSNNLLKVFGIGNKKIKNLEKMNIHSINNLKKAEQNKKVVLTHQQLLGLKYYDKMERKISRNTIITITDKLRNVINNIDDKIKITNAGSFRAGKSYSGDIDLLVHCNKINVKLINEIITKLINEKIIEDIFLRGTKKLICVINIDNKFYQMDILFINTKELPWYLLYFGSSRDFSKKIRLYASKKGYKLNEKGLFDKITGKKIKLNVKKEEDIFKFLKIKYIKPENRNIKSEFL
jgi:apurinic endonuclease APN1